MALLTISSITEYEPDILNFGISDFSDEITKAQADVFRDLRIKWWPTNQIGLYDAKVLAPGEPDEEKYNESQLTRAACYQCLGYHIYPKLAKFDETVDIFERKMEFYRKEYDREFDNVLRDGVEYDQDSGGTISNAEKEPTHFLRLKR